MNRLLAFVTLASLSLAPASFCSAGEHDWPQWQGPGRDGLSSETGLLAEWPEGGPPLAWMVRSVGLGYSGPAIVDGKIYILGALDGVSHLIALDEATGERLWATEMGAALSNNWGDGPRSTPTVDGDRIYAMAANGQLACFALADGKKVWQVSILDLGGKLPMWGYCESPLVDGDRVLCTPGGSRGTVAALDKQTGKLLWQSKGVTEEAQYSSIIKSNAGGREQYVALTKTVFGLDPADGAVLWQQPWDGVAVIPTPLAVGNKVYITTGYGAGCRLIDLGASGADPATVYDNKDMKNKHDGFVLLDGHIYGYSEGVGWVCQDFETGEMVWRERSKLGKGSLATAEGMLYCISEDDGEVALIKATPEGWQEHGRFTLTPQTEQRKPSGRIWTHPVISNGKLYLRDQELLFAFDVAQ